MSFKFFPDKQYRNIWLVLLGAAIILGLVDGINGFAGILLCFVYGLAVPFFTPKVQKALNYRKDN